VIQVSITLLEKLHGRRLEVVILDEAFINSVGDFSPEYEWTYNRDVDYCLTARELGEKIYQIPVRLFHHESRDNKRVKQLDSSKVAMESRNLARLQTKWANSKFYKTLDRDVENG
jgi:GT2 family glycosyltransferase